MFVKRPTPADISAFFRLPPPSSAVRAGVIKAEEVAGEASHAHVTTEVTGTLEVATAGGEGKCIQLTDANEEPASADDDVDIKNKIPVAPFRTPSPRRAADASDGLATSSSSELSLGAEAGSYGSHWAGHRRDWGWEDRRHEEWNWMHGRWNRGRAWNDWSAEPVWSTTWTTATWTASDDTVESELGCGSEPGGGSELGGGSEPVVVREPMAGRERDALSALVPQAPPNAQALAVLKRARTADLNLELNAEDAAKEAHATYMRFFRSLRSSATPPPPEIAAKFASVRGRRKEMCQLFEDFVQASEDWSQSTIVLNARVAQGGRRMGSMQWFSRFQLEERYPQPGMVDRLIGDKTRLGQFMDNPDFPGDESQRLYRCFDRLSEETFSEWEIAQNVTSSAELSAAGAAGMISQLVPQTGESSLVDLIANDVNRPLPAPTPLPAPLPPGGPPRPTPVDSPEEDKDDKPVKAKRAKKEKTPAEEAKAD